MLHQQTSRLPRLQYITIGKLIKPWFCLVVKTKQNKKKMKIDVQHSEAIQNGQENFTTSKGSEEADYMAKTEIISMKAGL